MLPLAKVALIVLLTEAPAMTETLLGLSSEKSNVLVLANHRLATELGFALFLKAWAFSHPSLEIVIGPEYLGDDCFGDVPSVV